MKTIYIATGYNSFTNKQLTRAFTTETEADQFLQGLTDPRLNVISYNSTAQLVNKLLGN